MSGLLGKLEARLFAYTQMRGVDTVSIGEIANVLRISYKQSTELLSRLNRKKLAARVNRGFYLLPTRIPPGGIWAPSEYRALDALMASVNGNYQITGMAAFNRYGWENQIPQLLDIYNNRISGMRKVGIARFRFTKVDDARLGDTISLNPRKGESACYSSRARALLDAVYDWKRFYGLPRAYRWIRREIKENSEFIPGFVQTVLRFGNIGTIRRIGKLLESERVSADQVQLLYARLKPSSSVIPWIPFQPKRGVADLKWGVVMNG